MPSPEVAAPTPVPAAERVDPTGSVTYLWHTALSPAWLDPQENAALITPYAFQYALHDAVVKHLPGQPLAPSLAESYEIPDDFMSATFVLRDLYGSPASGAGWVVPAEYYQQVGPDGFKQNPIGAGPYRLVQQTGDELVFEAVPDYWRRAPHVETLIIRAVPEAATRVAALQAGEADFINLVPPYFSLAERVISQLRAIGITLALNTMERGAFSAMLAQGVEGAPPGIILNLSGAPGDAAGRIRSFAICPPDGASSRTCDEQIDQWFDQYEHSTDPQEREQLSHQIQEYILDEYIFVPLFRQAFINAQGARIANEWDEIFGAVGQYPYVGPYEDVQLRD